MTKIGIRFLVLLVIVCISIPVINVSAADAVSISMTSEGIPQAGNEIIIKIAVGKPSKALAGIEFTLEFDSELVSPTVTKNSESGLEMNSLVAKIPSDWEQMCSYSKSESKYYFRFAMPDSENFLTSASGIILEIPFRIDAPGVADFRIADEEIIAIQGNDSFSLLTGKGCEMSIVAAGADEKFAVELGNSDTVPENGLYYLEIQAINLGDSQGIIGLEFALEYDKSVFKPYITANDNYQMDVFMADMPKDSWEQMCTLYESENKYVLRFAALHAESLTKCEKLESGKSLTLSVPFIVIGSEGDTASFKVDSVSALGVNNKTQKIIGRGDVKSISVGKSDSLVPAWMFETVDGHLLYASEKTSIKDFLKPLSGLYVTHNGEKITDGYVKTGYTLTNGSSFLTIVVKGDASGDGTIDTTDYVLTKRAYYGTFKPTATQLLAMALTNKKDVVMTDYILIKRHYFGTFDLNQ